MLKRILDWLLSPAPAPTRGPITGRRVYRMGSLEFEAEDREAALRKAGRAVFEGHEAPLDEAGGAFTAEEVHEVAALGTWDEG